MQGDKDMKRRKSKVTSIKRTVATDKLSVAVFAFILIYMLVSIFSYLNSKHIVGYEVVQGSLSENNIYRAVALRTETVVNNTSSGSVYYFATEARHVAKNDLVCIVDEADTVSQNNTLVGQTDSVTLDEDDYSEIQESVVNYLSTFDKNNFSTVYDFKKSISGTVSKLVNTAYLENIAELNSSTDSFSYQNAPASGTVTYSIDGYESLTLSDMTSELLDEDNYEQTYLSSGDLITTDSPVYKLATDEDWSIVIQVDSSDTQQKLADEGYIQVRFVKNQVKLWGEVETFTNSNNEYFVELKFTNSMITFATDRFLSVELLSDTTTGLKIPNTAIFTDDFYLIPSEYINIVNGDELVVSRKTTLENGESSTEQIEVEAYSKVENTDDDGTGLGTYIYYIDKDALQSGDILINNATDEEFSVGETGELKGVYNINKGYADFCVINIKASNDTYSIVESNTKYGLREYDYIVLDASSVDNDEFLYE